MPGLDAPGLEAPGNDEPWNQHTWPRRAIAGGLNLSSELLVPERERDHLTPRRAHAQTEEAHTVAGIAGTLTSNPDFERNLPEEFPHDMG